MKSLIGKSQLFKLSAIILLSAAAAVCAVAYPGEGSKSPAFYLGTDKTFGTSEKPYVNLEGQGTMEYTFRIYRVKNADDFFVKSVKGRRVHEANDEAYGNAAGILSDTFNYFKKDFRTIARKEFNSKTRSSVKNSVGVDLDSEGVPGEIAIPGFLSGHEFVSSFSIPKGKGEWSYRKVPVPIRDNGVYLVEAISGKNVGHTVIVKSNINFVSKQSDSQTLVYIAKRDSGTPVDDAEVKIFGADDGKLLSSGVAKKGIYSVSGKTQAKTLIIAKKGGEYSVSDPDFYSKSFYGEGGIRTYIYTERPVYRPGDTVYFKGIVRQFSGDDYSVASGGASVKVLSDGKEEVASNIPVQVSSDTGTFSGSFQLPSGGDVFLGTYNLILSFKDKDYSTEFAVDAYKKPPFFVRVSAPKRVYIGKEKIQFSASARFYYGGAVSDADVRYRIFRKKKFDYSPVGALPFFAEASEYLGITSNTTNDLVADGKGKTDGDGLYEFSVTPKDVDDDYIYTAMCDVTTPDTTMGGSTAVSVNRSAFFIRTYKEMAVYSPGDKVDMKVQLVAFDPLLSDTEKKNTLGGRKVKAVLYTRTFVHISQEGERDKVDSQSVVTGPDGYANLSFKLPKKGHYILHLESEDSSGELTSAETPFWASGKSDSIEVPFKNITLKTSKDVYEVGEEADVLIMTPSADGTLFLTLEGNRIISHETIALKGNTYRYKVKITNAMAPNFTVSVTQFAGNEVYKNQIKVVAPPLDRFLTVKLTPLKKEYRPGDNAEVSIETLSYKGKGVSSEVSLAVVDEAVYQIREDTNPNIGTYFYHPRSNNVSTVFSSAYRFFGYSEEKRLKLALDAKKNPALAALKEEDERSRERFKDTTFWTAKVNTDANGKATVKVPLADNITTWRVSALAVTRDTKVGQGRTSFLSRKRLMVNAGLPSFMIRGDNQTVVANVTNLTEQKMQLTVEAVTDGGALTGKKTEQLTLDAGKSAPVYFEIKAADAASAEYCTVEFRVKGGGLSDGDKRRVPLKYFGRKTTDSSVFSFGGGSKSLTETVALPSKMSGVQCELRLSPGAGAALRESLDYLAGYPYGCIEQTMSRFMPLLAAKQSGNISPDLASNLPSMVAEGLRLIKSHQMSDGGFGWYGGQTSDPMMSAYVYRGLVTCKKLFGVKDQDLVSRTRYYLYDSLEKYGNDPFVKAYVLFSLSEGDKIQKSMVESVVKASAKQGPYTKALAALVCINSGDERGKILFSNALGDFNSTKKDAKNEDWKSDRVETMSALLYAAAKLGQEDTAETLAHDLIAEREGIAWKNTRDTAWAVIAISEKLKKYRESASPSEITVSINGTEQAKKTLSAADVASGSASVTVPASAFRAGSNSVTVKKSGSSALYATLLTTFIDKSDSFAPVSNGMSISRSYYKVEASKTSKGYSLSMDKTSDFKTGDLVMVELDVSSNGRAVDYVMVSDALPAGFSVVRNDGEYFGGKYPKEYESRQAYDDRVVFFKHGPFSSSVFRYFLRADIPGNYRVIPADASRMYYPGTNASGRDSLVKVGR
jgi:uncharacterized protein YfaS (alpha-2-macroglobulin family)